LCQAVCARFALTAAEKHASIRIKFIKSTT
jgi:hypothetical protein